jgi:putative transferase (TIGR04331 family)
MIPKDDSLEINSYRLKLYEKYVTLLSEHLNYTHNISKSKSYWEIIIGPWLFQYICHADYIYRMGNSADLKDILASNITPFDYTSNILLYDNEEFVAHLRKCYVDASWMNTMSEWECIEEKLSERTIKSIARIILEKIGFILVKIGRVVVVDSMLDIKQIISVFIRSRCRVIPLFLRQFEVDDHRIDVEKRVWKQKVQCEDDFEHKVFDVILFHLPFVYVEGFIKLCNSVKNIKPNILLSAMGWGQNERMKVIAAETRQNGGKLIGLQHGGGPYGVGCAITVDQEIKLLDRFLTWGWSYDVKQYPFFSTRIERLLKKIDCSKRSDYILYITTSASKIYPDGMGIPSGKNFETCYLEWQYRFLQTLPEKYRKMLLLRVNPLDSRYGWNQQRRIDDLGLDIKIDSKTIYAESLSKASMIVCDNNYTTFFESVAANIPTHLYFNIDCWCINKKALSLYEEMKAVGMFSDTPESAAKQVAIIASAPEQWWKSREVIEVRKRILNQYGRTSENTMNALIKALDM